MPKRRPARRSVSLHPKRPSRQPEQRRAAPTPPGGPLRKSRSAEDLYPLYPRRQKRPLDFEWERTRCLRDRTLFEDPEFPPELAILRHPRTEWKRPFEIVRNPRFFTPTVTRHDIQQMGLGDCFFLAPLSLITERPDLIRRVVPPGQSFDRNFYAGVFHFRLWKYGEWLDVVVDDRLPVNVRTGRLRFTRARAYNVFWVSLLEKAFAKIYGGYANIQGGHAAFAMQCLTGGISVFNLWRRKSTAHLERAWARLATEFRLGVLFCPKSGSRRPRAADRRLLRDAQRRGIQLGHAYALTALRQVETTEGPQRLVRIRNPWGRLEWSGDWSSESRTWHTVLDPALRRDLLDKRQNGEFWMSFADFARFFKNVDRCYVGPEVMAKSEPGPKGLLHCGFDQALAHDAWEAENATNGGGFPKGIQRGCFHLNPQYVVTLRPRPDSVPDAKGRLLLIWQVVQKHAREHGLRQLFTGCVLYRLDEDQRNAEQRFDNDFFRTRLPMNMVEYSILSSQRKKYAPGSYLIVPFCHRPTLTGYFLLRIYANATLKLRKLG